MKQKKEKSGSVKIVVSVLEEAKSFCKPRGTIIGFFVTEAVREKLIKEKKEFLK